MVSFVRRFLLAKLALVVLVTVALGFGVMTLVNASMQLRTMEQLQHDGASMLARSLAAGVRNAMLTGNGIAVRRLLDDAEQGIERASVQVYSAEGDEVFGAERPAPRLSDIPGPVRSALLAGAQPAVHGGADVLPILNEPRCKACHTDGETRGVLTLDTTGARVALDGSDASLDVLARVAEAGFVQIMTGRHEDDIDAYFAELSARTPAVSGVGVFTTTGEAFFEGGALDSLPAAAALGATREGAAPSTTRAGETTWRLIPLENAPRCQGCHDDDEPMRGALAIGVDAAQVGRQTLADASVTSLQHVMLSGLGRLINGFLDDVAATGAVSALTLHDHAGRLYHDAFTPPSPPAIVAEALATGEQVLEWSQTSGQEAFVFVEPLENRAECQSCHGTDKPLRGAIAVRLDGRREAAARVALRDRTAALVVGTLLLVALLLALGLSRTVIGPVRHIGSVADAIGEGRLDAKVELQSLDEMGRLATRINDMVEGLRQKFELSKFVSRATLERVEESPTVVRGGARRLITVLFSDVRGFTAYSEQREPEQVVEVLNHYLQAQADVVARYGGDIDKFVGDELMARFRGEDHARRAVMCAVDLVAAAEQLARETPDGGDELAIGVGVNTGVMVLGAMGSEDRMDFTVIGDAVNLGARLCSAAGPGEVLLSDATLQAAGPLQGIDVKALEPIRVKGKEQPIAVHGARRVS